MNSLIRIFSGLLDPDIS